MDAMSEVVPGPDPVLMYDGDCAMCTGSVRLVLRLDRSGQFRFLSIGSETGKHLYRELGLDPETPDTVVLLARGNAYVKSDAILRTAILLGLPWSVLGVGLLLPERLRDFVYDFVARNRKRFQRAPRCHIPSAKERARFLG